MRVLALVLVAALSLGCSRQESSEAMDLASSAHEEATKANRALDAGTGSGTTMGDEVQELQNRLDSLEQENRQLRADVDELQHQIRTLPAQAY